LRKMLIAFVLLGFGFLFGILYTGKFDSVQAQKNERPGAGFAAVPGEIGGEDVSGPYEVVPDWPKPLTSLPGHEKWTWGSIEGIFAESPNRIFIAQRGELPALKRPVNTPVPQFGPSLSFPVNEAPFRNASQGPVGALPGGGPTDTVCGPPDKLACTDWKGKEGVDARWEHVLVVVDAQGNVTEDWSQWISMFRRPHAVYINPYDPEKNVWVVEDGRHAIYKFTNDGKKLLLTLGTPDVPGSDDKHFNRPTFLAWLPDGTMFAADGYNNTRIVKYDKDSKYLMAWGERGNPPNETRPGYMNGVHGLAVDPDTRRVFVSDRSNRRCQVFDENGKYLYEWSFGNPASAYYFHMAADHHLWVVDSHNWKILKYDLQGHLLYSWGTYGDWPGSMWGVHQISVDQEGNLYTAEVSSGRVQKFRPRKGANPDYLVGQPVRAAWK
jgi:sugar lactone lactonase YvrE